jgi:L-threonylcarbamoyladenylate synthase
VHYEPPHSQSAEILPTHTPALFQAAVARAAELLKAGQTVALPTETVYGLAANAFDTEAVHRIYEIKGRPLRNPIIVHVADVAMARRCVSEWPALAQSLAASFWPGPLTLVLPRSREIPDVVTGGGPTVGVRCPSHPLIQAVIRECGFPLAAPSANPANQLSPTTAEHVRRHLGDRLPMIVDGGPSNVGIESTVLDLTASPPRVLRPGMIHNEALQAVIGVPDSSSAAASGPLKSPGMLPRHYSPRARLLVWKWENEEELLKRIEAEGCKWSETHVVAYGRIPSGSRGEQVSVVPHDSEAYARALYAELHRCDNENAKLIVVEAPPDSPEWLGIADRLKRAAGHGQAQ